MKKPIKAIIIGLGSRGFDAYGSYMIAHKEEYDIVGVADPVAAKRTRAKALIGLADDRCFEGAEAILEQPKFADIALICTQDSDHLAHSILAMEAGYDLILEKPIGISLEECDIIYEKSQLLNKKVFVCHVLRYTKFYKSLKEVIDSGDVGQVVNVTAKENVGYYHYAHSYVRGNWRNKALSSPMIVAKCCHDTDIISWLVGRKCQTISSTGSLMHFREENAPVDATHGCLNGCAVKEHCPYDAEKIYITGETGVHHTKGWPVSIVTDEALTEENVRKALKDGPYGRCVYFSDNDVVDHQIVWMSFEGGASASLTMCGPTGEINRDIVISCSLGEIKGDMEREEIIVTKFGEAPKVIDLSGTRADESHVGHGGGDFWLMHDIYEHLTGINVENPSITSIKDSVHGHKIAFLAEVSRMKQGQVLEVK